MRVYAEFQCSEASELAAARKWDSGLHSRRGVSSVNGLLGKLQHSGLEGYLIKFLSARDLAKLSMLNLYYQELCQLHCIERLRFFLGPNRERERLEADDMDLDNDDLECRGMVQHFLKYTRTTLPRLLHVVAHCREQTFRTTLSLGEAHTAVILPGSSYRQVFLFGEGSKGQLGNGVAQSSIKPCRVDVSMLELPALDRATPLGNPIAVACGAYHTALLTDCGRLITFGFNNAGQLGDGTREARCAPGFAKPRFETQQRSRGPTRYTQVVAGRFYTAAITESGRVAIFGRGLGCDLERGFLLAPGDIDMEGGERIVQMAGGQEHLVMRSNFNRVYAVGHGDKGKLGIAANLVPDPGENDLPEEDREQFERLRHDTGCRAPKRVPIPESEVVVQVAAGGTHSALVTGCGNLYTWGGCAYGELGLGLFKRCVPKPTRVELPVATPFALHVSCGYAHTAVLTTVGKVLTFGDGVHRQDGKNSRFFATARPQEICLGELAASQQNLSSVICGGRHSATLDASGNLFTFGDPACSGRPFRSRSVAQLSNYLPKSVKLEQQMEANGRHNRRFNSV